MNRILNITVVFAWLLLAMSLHGLPRLGFAQESETNAPLLIWGLPANATDNQPDHSAVVVRQRIVKVAARALTGGAVPRTLVLKLFQDTQYTASLLWTESGSDGGLAWIGRLADEPNSRISIVVSGDRVSAIIRVDGRRYDLRPLENGLHVVQQIATSPLPAGQNWIGGTSGNVVTAASSSLVRGDLMNDEERQVLALVNEERSKVDGLSPLTSDDRLTAAAQDHSQDMSDQDYFSHTSLDGRTPADRIADAGYGPYGAWGENIAYGYTTPEAVMNGWMNSSGHRANILSESFCDLGVGYVAAGHYWTQDFGRLMGVTACSAANHEPVADFTAQPVSGLAPLEVNLDAGASHDPDGDDLSYSWTLGDGQSATTTPLAHTYTLPGSYTIRLTVADGHGGTNTAQQQITVKSESNTAPQAKDDAYVCDLSHSLSVPSPGVLDNDDDAENPDALSAVLITAPAHGSLLLSTDGAFNYQPAPDFSGEEQFTYKATDGQFQSEAATVTISVRNVPSHAGTGDAGTNGGGSGGCFVDSLPGFSPR